MKTDAIRECIDYLGPDSGCVAAKNASAELAALEADNARMRVALYKICDIEEERSPGASTKVEGVASQALTGSPSGKEKYVGPFGDEIQPAGKMLTCEWRQGNLWDTPDVWDTECGEMFYFGDGKPCEDGIDYCCYCGKKIVRIDAKPDEEFVRADREEIDQVAYGEQVSELRENAS